MRHSVQRGARIAIALSFAAFLAACASTADRAGRTQTYVGWVRFTGEFLLYYDASSFADSQRSHCVSGALPATLQKQAASQFNGKRVLITARPVAWSLPEQALTMSNEGSPITNWCGDKVVLFASAIRTFEQPAASPYQ